MKLYRCRRCGKLCRRGAPVCWNCGVGWPGLPGWLRLLSNRFSFALATLIIGAFILYRAIPLTEKERLPLTGLESRRPGATLKSGAVDETGWQKAGRGSPGQLEIEMKRKAAEEKSTPEKKPAIEEETRPAEASEGGDGDGSSQDTWSVQVAAFREEGDAQRLVDRLEENGYEARIASGQRWHRVLIGEFASFKEADRLKADLVQEQGFSDAFLRKGWPGKGGRESFS